MKKTLMIAGALMLATATTTAFAQEWRPYEPGYGYYGGPGSYRDYVRQLRACQRHAQLHRELDGEHAQEHAEGLEGPGDHRDLHDALGEAHEQYHEDHPRADVCDAMGMGNGPAYRYGYAPYGYDWQNPGYRSGFSFGFGFGR